ncbi:MAG: hypothetical protein M3082_20635 [Candidatus Dormibacteraeota bacterium]|nr:hypothetical protein [Candidatus Dormibacteraeota bacterium]
MSLPRQRFAATLVMLLVFAWAGLAALTGLARAQASVAGTLAPSTWVALRPVPHQGRSAIFALAVDPLNNQVVVAGTADGTLIRSADGGSTWKQVHGGSAGLLTIGFSPFKAGLLLAGTRGTGALASRDAGLTWAAVKGTEARSVRVFGFALTRFVAGTDQGVYASVDGITWKQSGLANVSIAALAVTAVHDPARMVAGSDSSTGIGGVPLFQSTDGGTSWSPIGASISGKVVACLAAGPLPPPPSTVRPLVVGTNAGLFTSRDNGTSFIPNSGGGGLPSTDYTQIAFVTSHYERYYAASDGGGSASGGLWRTSNAGRSFASMAPPLPSVTALAVSNDEAPTLYVATFRPSDQMAVLWAYHDTGGPPQGSPATVTPSTSGSRITPPLAGGSGLSQFLLSSRMPYIAVGLAALIVIGLAVVTHFRSRRG